MTRPDTRPLLRRFFKNVDVVPAHGGFDVRLDGRTVKTPAKRNLRLPNAALAAAVADEWRAQGERLDPATMPLTRLANTAIDRVLDDPSQAVIEAMRYAGSDLVCYRAPAPPELGARQHAHWQPVIDRLAGEHGVALGVTHELTAVTQPAEAIERLRAAVETLDAFALTGLHSVAGATGSLALAFAALRGWLDAAATAAAAHVDEEFQEERWGADREAAERRAAILREIDAAIAFARLARD